MCVDLEKSPVSYPWCVFVVCVRMFVGGGEETRAAGVGGDRLV